jgi:hypothetical protein
MSGQTVKITIDGTVVEAREGLTILQAAGEAGIYIPHLCYHKDLLPGGHCRVCTVKVNGKPINACTMVVGAGMVIENDTAELNDWRKSIIEMLFVEGNHICPGCEKSGNCELQALAYRFGMMSPRYPYLFPPSRWTAPTPTSTSTATAASCAGAACVPRRRRTTSTCSASRAGASTCAWRWIRSGSWPTPTSPPRTRPRAIVPPAAW